MLIRVRHPGGTSRITVDQAATLGQLCEGIGQALGIGDGEDAIAKRLSRDPRGLDMLPAVGAAATLASLGLEHGSMIHLQPGTVGQPEPAAADVHEEGAGSSPPSPSPPPPRVEPALGRVDAGAAFQYDEDPEMAEAIAIARAADAEEELAAQPRAPDGAVRERLIGGGDDSGFAGGMDSEDMLALARQLIAAEGNGLRRGAAATRNRGRRDDDDDDDQDRDLARRGGTRGHRRRQRQRDDIEAATAAATLARGDDDDDDEVAASSLYDRGADHDLDPIQNPTGEGRLSPIALGGGADDDDDDAALQRALYMSAAAASAQRGDDTALIDDDGGGVLLSDDGALRQEMPAGRMADEDTDLARALAMSLADADTTNTARQGPQVPPADNEDDDDVAFQEAL